MYIYIYIYILEPSQQPASEPTQTDVPSTQSLLTTDQTRTAALKVLMLPVPVLSPSRRCCQCMFRVCHICIYAHDFVYATTSVLCVLFVYICALCPSCRCWVFLFCVRYKCMYAHNISYMQRHLFCVCYICTFAHCAPRVDAMYLCFVCVIDVHMHTIYHICNNICCACVIDVYVHTIYLVCNDICCVCITYVCVCVLHMYICTRARLGAVCVMCVCMHMYGSRWCVCWCACLCIYV